MSMNRLLRIASFDAGGARSIFQLEIMKAIMDQARRIQYPDDHDKVMLPCELFDVIGGTDTGGLITIMLTRLRMSVEEAITEFGIIVEKVYTNKLGPEEKTENLRQCMEALLIKRNLPVDLRLGTEDHAERLGFVITERMSDGYLKTLQTRHGSGLVTVVEAVLATCALQHGFLPVTLPTTPYKYVGPGLGASNPIHHVITEALFINDRPLGDSSITLLLSIGSGTPGMTSFVRRHYSRHARHERQQDVAKDEMARKFLEHADKDGAYFRFSLEQETQGNDLDVDMDGLGRIATQTDLYLRNPDTVKRIEDSAGILINPDAMA